MTTEFTKFRSEVSKRRRPKATSLASHDECDAKNHVEPISIMIDSKAQHAERNLTSRYRKIEAFL